MVAVQVVVPHVLVKRVPEVGLAPDQRAVQQLGTERLDPAFHDRFHAGHLDPGQHSGDTGVAEDLLDQRRVFGVAVSDEEPRCRGIVRCFPNP